MEAIVKTDFHFPGQTGKYTGKVRDVYDINGEYLVMVVTDRISAFDVILVTNADKMLADAGSDALTWILDHAENDDSMTLVLSGIDENLIKIK